MRPNEAWSGTIAALQAAVAPSQHRRTRNEKKPTTNWEQNRRIMRGKSRGESSGGESTGELLGGYIGDEAQ